MGLGVVSRFSTLVEAEVACGALRSAGFRAQVFDQVFGTMVWTDQVAIGGFRVVVPDDELADAVAYLTEVQRTRPRGRPLTPRDKAIGWRLLALLAGLAVMPEAGWLVLGARDRAARLSALRPAAVLLIALILGLAVALAALIVIEAGAFIDGWLIHPRI